MIYRKAKVSENSYFYDKFDICLKSHQTRAELHETNTTEENTTLS